MQAALLFLEGIVTFISPCLLPMLPVYISFFAAGEPGRRRTLINASGFVLGFTAVFVALGALSGSIGQLLSAHKTAVNVVAGAVVLLLGLNFIGLFKIGFLNKTGRRNMNTKNMTFFSALLFGIVFSVGWTPCVGAFLGSALMMASSEGSTLAGVWMLLVYSLGLGLPFVLSALLIDRLKGAFDWIKRHYRAINLISGGLLILVGVLMATGLLGRLLALLSF